MAAPARNSTNSRGVPLWLEPPQTNLLFNSHAQAQVCHRTGGSNPWLTDPRQRSASHTFLPPWTARAVRAGQDDAALHLWFGRDDGLRQKLAALRQEGAIAILTMTMFGCTPLQADRLLPATCCLHATYCLLPATHCLPLSTHHEGRPDAVPCRHGGYGHTGLLRQCRRRCRGDRPAPRRVDLPTQEAVGGNRRRSGQDAVAVLPPPQL